jgi:prolyl 4-hydroxylase
MRHLLRILLLLTLSASPSTATPVEYGADVSFPMHFAELPPRDPDILGRDQRQQMYQDHLQGCFDYYNQERCMEVENDRIAMNLRQPQSMVNYTKNGFVKIRAPDEVWELIQEFWRINQHNTVEESWPSGSIYVNHWSADVKMVSVENHTLVGGGNILKNAIWNAARTTLEEWTGHTMADCSLYGIRVYGEGSILAPHVDRLPLTSSAILNVDQDLDEPWPLEVIGHDGKAHNVTMEPGDLVLYESHSIIHGQ